MSGYANCVCCGEIFVSNGPDDVFCESCVMAECDGEDECQKPMCACGEYMEVGVNGEFECFAGCDATQNVANK